MIELNTEQYKVANLIKDRFDEDFDILINLENEEHYLGNMFPDIILLNKVTKTPLFVIEIRKNGRISECMKQWVNSNIPATLYIVVPQKELSNAKSIATVIGLKSRFGWYSIDNEGNISDLIFE